MSKKKEYYSCISTPMHISQSEVSYLYPDYEFNWNEERLDDLNSILFDLGMDTKQHWEFQDVSQHRNRMNQVVTCNRYYGVERSDTEWLQSGYASTAAKDKALNSRMLDDCYRSKALTIDTQMALEARDKYNVVEDESDNGEE